jgi:hypothetical protein
MVKNIDEELYIINVENTDEYKIGRSHQVDDRKKSLQIGNPKKLIVCETYKYHNCVKLERYIHEYAKEHNVQGEWF